MMKRPQMDDFDRDGLAGEFVLGTLEGTERQHAEDLLAHDAAFRAAVADWRDRLAPIDDTAAPLAPTPALWDRIEAATRTEAPKTLGQARGTPRSVMPEIVPSLWKRMWNDLGLWRPLGLGASFAALALAVGLVASTQTPPALPALVAVLETAEGKPAAVVNAYADGTVQLVPIEAISAPEGRIIEVWTLQDRAQGPVSIGRLDRARSLKLDLRGLAKPSIGHLFEMTIEPAGGSPTGKPTGPVLMKGLAAERI